MLINCNIKLKAQVKAESGQYVVLRDSTKVQAEPPARDITHGSHFTVHHNLLFGLFSHP
jgi:hypothetical protein